MKRRGRRFSWLAAALVLASAWLPLPLPGAWLAADLPLGAGESLLHVRARSGRLRWADGRLELAGVRASLGAATTLELDTLALDLAPFRLLRGEPPLAAVLARGLRGRTGPADREQLLRLFSGGGSPPPLPAVRLDLGDGVVTWTDPETGLELPLDILQIRGELGPGCSSLHGRLRGPFGHGIQAWAREGPEVGTWQLDLACLAAPLAPGPGQAAVLPRGTVARAGRCAIRARARLAPAGFQELLLDVDLQGGSFHLARPALAVDGLHLRLQGAWPGTLGAEVQARVEGFPLSGKAWLAGTSPPLLLATARLGPVAVDEGLAARLQGIDPGAAEALAALDPRGVVSLEAGCAWQPGAPPLWAVHVPLEGMGMTYRGFREEDGSRPSFPYPVHDLAGDGLFGGRTLLFQVTGAMGAGRMAGQAVVEVGDGPAALQADLTVADLPVDAAITRAAAGTPELRRTWAELGHPHGGLVDATLAVRRPAPVRTLDVEVELDATARGVDLRPAFLPVPVRAREISFRWRPGDAAFRGQVAVLGGQADLEGRVRTALSDGLPSPVPVLEIRGRGRGLAPDAGERRILEAFLDLPAGAADFAVGGPVDLEVLLRRPAGEGPPQALVRFDTGGAGVAWQVTGIGCQELRGRGVVARAGLATLVSLPRAAGRVLDGRAEFSLAGVLQEQQGVLPIVARGEGIAFRPVLRETAERVLGIRSPSALELDGRLGGHVFLDPARPEGLRGRVVLESMRCTSRFREQNVALDLAGTLDLRGRQVHASRLEIRQAGRRSEIRNLLLEARAGGGLQLRASLVSRDGIEVAPALAGILEPGAAEALAAVGLQARIRADGLQVAMELPAAEEEGLRLDARGRLLVDELRLEGPPRLRGGSAILDVEELHWRSAEDYGADLRFREGAALMEELHLTDARGRAVVDQDGIVIRPFTASLLGGRVLSTPSAGRGGENVPEGVLRLGFAPGPPLRFRVYLEDLSLERMREELDLAAGLAGQVSGHLDMASTTPSPLDYAGRGELFLTDGALGAVPVLKDIWRAAGVRPPQFHSGRIVFSTNAPASRGTVRVEEFRLEHELLEAFGKGWLDMDGYLRLKVTVRTFSVLGRLPLVKDLLDVLLEQDVFGPLEQPVITHRAYGKLAGRKHPRYPFPLWAPAPPWPDWRLSPILPQDAGDTRSGAEP